MEVEELVVGLIKEGVQIPLLARASGIPEDDLWALGIQDESQALPEAALSLAWMAIEKGKEILRSGTQANQLRLVATIFNHVMRSYKGESPKAFQDLQSYIGKVLSGEDIAVDDEPELD